MTFSRRLGVWALLASCCLFAGSAWAEGPGQGGEERAEPPASPPPEPAPPAPASTETPPVGPAVVAPAEPVVLEPARPVKPLSGDVEARTQGGSSAGRVVGLVAMGVGGAALLTGGVFGVLALRDEARLSARCPRDTCTPDQQSAVDTYESKKLVSGIGLLSGVLLGAGGAALFVLSSGSGPAGAARGGVYWAGREAGVWGAF